MKFDMIRKCCWGGGGGGGGQREGEKEKTPIFLTNLIDVKFWV